MMVETALLPVENIAAVIVTIRGQRVILDSDLARLYGITTGRFNEAVKRNLNRFPPDFMFQLAEDEYECLISQNAISNPTRGGRRFLPYAFTEHGAVMAATILNTPKAVEVSVYVVRAFVQQRALLAGNVELALKLEKVEKKLLASIHLLHEHDDRLDASEAKIDVLIETINALLLPPASSKRPIGFQTGED